jgi:hypothetical protein
MNEYYEELPESCPPTDAVIPEGEFFRLIEGDIPLDRDFFSHRALNPLVKYNACECTARAVSVYSELKSAISLCGMPRHRGKKIVKVSLNKPAGLVRRQGQTQGHHSWWRAKAFDVLKNCSIIV